jgi:hypothetical protein
VFAEHNSRRSVGASPVIGLVRSRTLQVLVPFDIERNTFGPLRPATGKNSRYMETLSCTSRGQSAGPWRVRCYGRFPVGERWSSRTADVTASERSTNGIDKTGTTCRLRQADRVRPELFHIVIAAIKYEWNAALFQT